MPIYIDGSETVTVNDGILSPNFGRKNAVINGNFDIWQRGISQTINGYDSDDRWRNDSSGSTKTHTQEVFTLGQTDVPNEPEFFSRTVVSTVAGASNFVAKIQKIEDVRKLAGQKATLSFYAKTVTTPKNIAIEFSQFFGTGGAPSAIVTAIGSQLVNLGTTWQRYEITVDVPSIAGKTIGSNGDDDIRVLFWFDAGSDFDARTASLGQQSGTFDIAQVQLEKGSVATDFEQRSIGEELALCQRYYQIKNQRGIVANAANTTTMRAVSNIPEMRAAPTAAVLDTTIAVRNSAAGYTSTGTTITADATPKSYSVVLNGFTGLTAGDMYIGNADDDYLALDAEL